MRVCWTGTFEPSFERNKRLAEYLSAANVHVERVRIPVWPIDRVHAFEQNQVSLAIKLIWAQLRLLLVLLARPRPDIYFVSYPGWFDVPVVKLISTLKRRPLVFDPFISLYDTAITDRQLLKPTSLIARLARLADSVAVRLSDRVIVDCPAHARFMARFAGISEDKFGVVYLGADETTFSPSASTSAGRDMVLFYGTYVPLQGVEIIVHAAHELGESVQFRLVGEGQARNDAERVARDLRVDSIEFIDPLPQAGLVDEMAAASIVLGVFGSSPKANRVIPHKLFEAIACGRPVLTGATEAVTETFSEAEIATCALGDSNSLSTSISDLLADPDHRDQLAVAGRQRFVRDFSRDAQARRLLGELASVVEH